MPIKHKFIGFIIVIIGLLPFLTKVTPIATAIDKYTFLAAIVPGSIIYQAIIVILGLSLIWRFKPQVALGTSR